MKKLFFILILTCSVAFWNILFAQNDDQQWLIINQIGKQFESSSYPVYPSTNTLGNYIRMEGISMPNTTDEPDAANDLFVIFGDANNFNSRYSSFTGLSTDFYRGPFDSGETHQFSNSHGSPISYMYLTNRYEKDDLPRKVALYNEVAIIPDANSIRPEELPVLTASHNVVFNRDITVVVNYDMLRSHYKGQELPEFRLQYSGYEMIDGPDRGNTNIFDPSPVFTDDTGSPVPEYPIGKLTTSPTPEEVILVDGNENYRYFNLRTTDNALQFAPREDSSAQYNAVFNLLANESIISSIQESMTFAYDPNFIRVDSICRTNSGDYHVYYHLEFENTGEAYVSDYKARFKFKEHFDFSCFEVLKWSAAGKPCEGKAKVVADSVVFNFDCNTQLFLNKADPQAAIGYVEFRVKIPAPYVVINPAESIKFDEPKVNFAGVDFDIEEFRDKIVADSNKAYRPILLPNCTFCEGFNWLLLLLIALAIMIAAVIVFFVKSSMMAKKTVIEKGIRTP
jgi:hypothetical protein